MLPDSKITVSCTCRLFADEVCKLQEKIGCVVPLRDAHGSQNVQTVGLSPASGQDVSGDYVLMFRYLSSCTLAVLEEVTADSLILTRIDRTGTYQIKNNYRPFFPWDPTAQLCVIPPLFDRDANSVELESNGVTLLLPAVVPCDVAHEALQKVLTYHVYSRVIEADPAAGRMADVLAYTGTVTYLGTHYSLNLENMEASGALALLDNLAMYLAIMTGLVPGACVRLLTALLRHGENELLGVFRRLVPEELNYIDLAGEDIYASMTKIGMLMVYLQTLGSIFNLGPRLQLSSYVAETLLGTCWFVS